MEQIRNMAYLTLQDYIFTIQDRAFSQLVQGDMTKRLKAENTALDIIISHLTQKYDINSEFTDTKAWNPSITYNAWDRVIIDYSAWVSAMSYVVGNCVIYNGNGYVCKTPNSDATFTIGNWNLLGAQYSLYYCNFPLTCIYQSVPSYSTLANPYAPVFNLQGLYNVGDIVFWKNKTYVCNMATQGISASNLIAFYTYENVPYMNVFPDDTKNNATYQFWSVGTSYSVAAGTLPTDTTKWVLGDNRNPQILECMKHIVIWVLANLLTYHNCPPAWEDRYKESINTLKGFAEGKTTARIPLLQPKQGTRIRFGGRVKQHNSY